MCLCVRGGVTADNGAHTNTPARARTRTRNIMQYTFATAIPSTCPKVEKNKRRVQLVLYHEYRISVRGLKRAHSQCEIVFFVFNYKLHKTFSRQSPAMTVLYANCSLVRTLTSAIRPTNNSGDFCKHAHRVPPEQTKGAT